MNEDALVETMARGIAHFHRPTRPRYEFESRPDVYRQEARTALAEIRGAGWDTFRPDEAEVAVTVMADGKGPIRGFWQPGRYYVIPKETQ